MKLILASSSFKKIYILKQLGFKIHLNISFNKIYEKSYQNSIKSGMKTVHKKSRIVMSYYCQRKTATSFPILSIKNLILYDNKVINVAKNKYDLLATLIKISGKSYQIISLFSIVWINFTINKSSTTNIQFKSLNKEIIHYFIKYQMTNKNYSLYSIYENIALLISNIKGSYSNVIGIPVKEILECLCNIGYF
jgi:septum formation protein